MKENEESREVQDVPRTTSNHGDLAFHAVYIPRAENSSEEAARENVHVYLDKLEALKVIKECKTARLRTFKSRLEAEEYAKTGYEQNGSCIASSGSTLCIVEEKSSNFKVPKSQDLVCFRKLVESGDIEAVKSTVWENPRYLISTGDTPAILQEGCRYNALHIAVKADRARMCELILNTVSDTKFIQLLYGGEERGCYLDRAEIMLDRYLNTPDKGLNETPLHFAAKFGLKNVVRVLVSYSQCIKTLPNKYKQTPIDIVCSRKYQENEELKREIRMLIEDQYYVPVLRSEDNTLQPRIGEPFSPTAPLSLNTDPISPRVEVRAFAGPMTKSQAAEFKKKWKTPPRMCGTPVKRNNNDRNGITNSPVASLAMRLQDTEKGLERVGRDLAEEYKVPWKEYWPFLNDFADFRCNDGLTVLEKYLERRFTEQFLRDKEATKASKNAKSKLNDDIDFICNKLRSCSLSGQCNADNEKEDDEFFTPPSSPRLMRNHSEDEMYNAEEGTVTFIEGPLPAKIDYAVYNALPASINPVTHPNVYRWRHELQLEMKRDSHKPKDARLSRRRLFANA